MADVSVKMGVSGIGQFKQGMNEAQASVKTLDAALKANEEQFERTGNAEEHYAAQTTLLNQKLKQQQEIAKNAEAALKQMEENGVKKNSVAYQNMQRKLIEATAAMEKTKDEIGKVGEKAGESAGQTDKLSESLKGIGKNVSWQSVADGLGKITNKLESGARTAIRLGKSIARSAMDSTEWADDVLTRATQYGVDPETLQKMDNVASYIDTDVDTIISARDRLAKNQQSLAELLGIETEGKSVEDVFWEAGEAIMALGEGFDKSEISQKIFGRSWRELLPLFTAGREEYEALMDSQNVLTEDQVKKLGEADNAIKGIEQQLALMKNEFWAENAQKIIDLMQWLIDHKDEVVAALATIAAGFGALKLAEAAANVMQIVSGMKELGIIKGAESAAESAVTTAEAAKAASAGTTAAATGTASAIGALGLTGTLMLAPAIIAGLARNMIPEEYRLESTARVAAADYTNEDLNKLKQWVEIHNEIQRLEEAFGTDGFDEEKYAAAQESAASLADVLNTDIGKKFWDLLVARNIMPDIDVIPTELLDDLPEVQVELQAPEDAAAEIAKQVGIVMLPAQLDVIGQEDGSHANGLWSVPFDGYTAVLHKGERVVPAREVTSSRNYSSNLYVESMYMNNGQDAEGLAAAMAAAQRRTMSGYGS